MAAISLPDQIPPQGAPFVYQDDTGNWRMEVDWYLFLYAMWGQLVGQTGGVALTPAVNIPMADLDALVADTAQAPRQIANVMLLQSDPPDAGPTLRDVQNALVLALDALLQDPTSASTGLTNPMTTAGDLIVGGVAGAPARLAKGADGTVLTMVAGAEAWAASGGAGLSEALFWMSI